MIKGYILKFELKQLFLEKRRRRIETPLRGHREVRTYKVHYPYSRPLRDEQNSHCHSFNPII